MQRISKNRDGVTLVMLVITIIVLVIILSITLNYGLSELHDVANKKTESELSIVQEAVMQRYALVKSQNQLGKKPTNNSQNKELGDDTGRPEGFVGTRLVNTSEVLSRFGSSVSPLKNYTSEDTDLTFEEYYYVISEDNGALLELGIEKGDDSAISDDVTSKKREYIVNYLTGEIFDIANKKYYKTDMTNDDPVYTQPTQITMENKTYDFNDD